MSYWTQLTAFACTRFPSLLWKTRPSAQQGKLRSCWPKAERGPGTRDFHCFNPRTSQANWDKATALPKILLLALCQALPTFTQAHPALWPQEPSSTLEPYK